MGKIKAVIFDMDGTLVDNMGYHRRAWDALMHKHGLTYTDEAFAAILHGTVREIVARMFPDGSPEEVATLGEEKEALYRELYRPAMQPLPGLRPFLENLRETGCPTALATMGDRKNQEFIVNGLGLTTFFPTIVGGEDVQKGKPDPEAFLKAADLMQVAPSACLVFEDTVSGLAAARNAGMQAVALSTTHTLEELTPHRPLHIIPDYLGCNLPFFEKMMP